MGTVAGFGDSLTLGADGCRLQMQACRLRHESDVIMLAISRLVVLLGLRKRSHVEADRRQCSHSGAVVAASGRRCCVFPLGITSARNSLMYPTDPRSYKVCIANLLYKCRYSEFRSSELLHRSPCTSKCQFIINMRYDSLEFWESLQA